MQVLHGSEIKQHRNTGFPWGLGATVFNLLLAELPAGLAVGALSKDDLRVRQGQLSNTWRLRQQVFQARLHPGRCHPYKGRAIEPRGLLYDQPLDRDIELRAQADIEIAYLNRSLQQAAHFMGDEVPKELAVLAHPDGSYSGERYQRQCQKGLCYPTHAGFPIALCIGGA